MVVMVSSIRSSGSSGISSGFGNLHSVIHYFHCGFEMYVHAVFIEWTIFQTRKERTTFPIHAVCIHTQNICFGQVNQIE